MKSQEATKLNNRPPVDRRVSFTQKPWGENISALVNEYDSLRPLATSLHFKNEVELTGQIHLGHNMLIISKKNYVVLITYIHIDE